MDVHGVLLAAGAGRRMGSPKALIDDWLVNSVRTLRDGGCARVTVVLGASAPEAAVLLDDAGPDVDQVVAADWEQGMGASLRAGLRALPPEATAALVLLVDLPDVGAGVVRRLLGESVDPTTLRRASYDGRPGHPVLLGRDHWAAASETATGDRGARDYLATHAHALVECGDLATGQDLDGPLP